MATQRRVNAYRLMTFDAKRWFHRLAQGHCFRLEVTALIGQEYNPKGRVHITLKHPVSKERLRQLVTAEVGAQAGASAGFGGR